MAETGSITVRSVAEKSVNPAEKQSVSRREGRCDGEEKGEAQLRCACSPLRRMRGVMCEGSRRTWACGETCGALQWTVDSKIEARHGSASANNGSAYHAGEVWHATRGVTTCRRQGRRRGRPVKRERFEFNVEYNCPVGLAIIDRRNAVFRKGDLQCGRSAWADEHDVLHIEKARGARGAEAARIIPTMSNWAS
ncbi:hypothetical protein BV25DRAFT_164472 [Artomyces pyxidatus]|uniref:Uncharacterized protein n=1 Tax=Artomyces pyxidatus TaxID=48021 RepID=A0ACB8SH71_9AGAM|nr:hypothetical protein BV25DRAFT_164472 [Artomyces pyxidatus]